MMSTVAELIVNNPAIAGLIAGPIVAVIVQVLKALTVLPRGEAKVTKVLLAVVTAGLLSAAGQVLAVGGWDWGQFATVLLVAWATAAGVHGTALRGKSLPGYRPL